MTSPQEVLKSAILATLSKHTGEMGADPYHGSNPGVKESVYEDVADAVIAALPQLPSGGGDYETMHNLIQQLQARTEALEAQLAAASAPVWLSVKDSPPPAGPLVKRWKNGSVWAGRYNGSEKETSFDHYLVLPQFVKPSKGD